MASLKLQHLTLSGLRADSTPIDWELPARTFAAVTAPDGSGTALLRAIAGLEPVAGGEIVLGDRAVQSLPAAERGIAFVGRGGGLFPALSVAQNIALGLHTRAFRATPKAERAKRVVQAAELTGVAALLDRRAAALNPLESLRVALARAIVGQPQLVLLDEPLAALPAAERDAARVELMRLQQRLPMGFLGAFTEVADALAVAGQVALLHGGALLQHGTPAALYHTPASLTVAAALATGRPGLNAFRGRLRASEKTGGWSFQESGDGTLTFPVTPRPALEPRLGQEIVAGLFPERLSLASASVVSGSLPALIDAVEPRGGETWLHAHTGSHPFIARIPGSADRAEAGHRAVLGFDPASVLFFDPERGQRL
jgi:ABC-type sugar transport system ATPase subunit